MKKTLIFIVLLVLVVIGNMSYFDELTKRISYIFLVVGGTISAITAVYTLLWSTTMKGRYWMHRTIDNLAHLLNTNAASSTTCVVTALLMSISYYLTQSMPIVIGLYMCYLFIVLREKTLGAFICVRGIRWQLRILFAALNLVAVIGLVTWLMALCGLYQYAWIEIAIKGSNALAGEEMRIAESACLIFVFSLIASILPIALKKAYSLVQTKA